jgi:hypothetical protein
MSNIRITATIRFGDVYVRLGDVIKSLYADSAYMTSADENIKTYLKHSIKEWEEYDERILNEAKH